VKEIFVFVVCGKKEHIHRLNTSLIHLKRKSSKKIYVVTDLQRNNSKVYHSDILDRETSTSLSDHEASIYLKTNLHRILPKGNLYCYLDSDEIAYSADCDKIFKEFLSPIRFAQDHCDIDYFSPSATNCSCKKENQERIISFKKLLSELKDHFKKTKKPKAQLEKEFKNIEHQILRKPITNLRFKLSKGNKFKLTDQFWHDKITKEWYYQKDTIIYFDAISTIIEKKTGFVFDKSTQNWSNKMGESIYNMTCSCLRDNIQNMFGININSPKWRHWNGGVFLFNDSSREFMDAWHKKTLEIFKDPKWKIRDQGTLAATAWEFGLQNSKPLDKKWNFIADYDNPDLKFNDKTMAFSDDNFRTSLHPAFIHVYHHFGDDSWPIWKSIIRT
jgi:hypothetical protein